MLMRLVAATDATSPSLVPVVFGTNHLGMLVRIPLQFLERFREIGVEEGKREDF